MDLLPNGNCERLLPVDGELCTERVDLEAGHKVAGKRLEGQEDASGALGQKPPSDSGAVSSLKPEGAAPAGTTTEPIQPQKSSYKYSAEEWWLDPYDSDWWNSFDLFVLVAMSLWLLANLWSTHIVMPRFFSDFYTHHWKFFAVQALEAVVMLCIGACGGYLALVHNVRVNYTRKVQHFCAYLTPLLANLFYNSPYRRGSDEWLVMKSWNYWSTLMSFGILIYPVRTRVKFIKFVFAGLDRPEDRPNTLKWLMTQIFLGYVIILAFQWYFTYMHNGTASLLVFIPVLVTGIGDGLAEPVGVRFGAHKYSAYALCSNKKYTRSLEGSLCVYLSGVVFTGCFFNNFTQRVHFWVTLLVLPPLMTVAEAVSPHTWDTPFLMLTGCLVIWAVSFL